MGHVLHPSLAFLGRGGAGGVDAVQPSAQERARVTGILAEPEAPNYWFEASRDGNREAHYRGRHLGATLMHPLELWAHGEADEAAAHAGEGKRLRCRESCCWRLPPFLMQWLAGRRHI